MSVVATSAPSGYYRPLVVAQPTAAPTAQAGYASISSVAPPPSAPIAPIMFSSGILIGFLLCLLILRWPRGRRA